MREGQEIEKVKKSIKRVKRKEKKNSYKEKEKEQFQTCLRQVFAYSGKSVVILRG